MNSARNYIFGRSYNQLFLDKFQGAAIAVSLRKLKSNYTGFAIRVRRSSDNVESDFGFLTDGTLDTASLLSFVAGGNGFVSIWYDQSGNNRNLTQTITGSQPLIVSAGSLIVINGTPAILDPVMKTTSFKASGVNDVLSGFFVGKKNIHNGSPTVWFTASTGHHHFTTNASSISFRHNLTTTSIANILALNTQVILSIFRYSATMMKYYKNTSLIADVALNGALISGEFRFSGAGTYQEVIYYSSDMSSDIVGIHSDINTFYSIY